MVGCVTPHASALALRTAPVLPATLGDDEAAPLGPERSAPFQFEFFPDAIGYHTAMETRVARGTWGKGPMTAWMSAGKGLIRVPRGEGVFDLERGTRR